MWFIINGIICKVVIKHWISKIIMTCETQITLMDAI